jgi:hypothetical protein
VREWNATRVDCECHHVGVDPVVLAAVLPDSHLAAARGVDQQRFIAIASASRGRTMLHGSLDRHARRWRLRSEQLLERRQLADGNAMDDFSTRNFGVGNLLRAKVQCYAPHGRSLFRPQVDCAF